MTFLENKYARWYFSIVSMAKENRNIGIFEKHHILPKSLGGGNEQENLVLVTPREHFLLHRLLCRMTVGRDHRSMCWAIHRMMYNERHTVSNSHTYEILRGEHREMLRNSPHYKTPEWSRKIAEVVKSTWENNESRKLEASRKMKERWKSGKLHARDQSGEKNCMYGREPWNKGKKYPGSGRSGSLNSQAKQFTILTPTGEVDITNCLKTYCEAHSLTYACMVKVSQGKNKQHRGYMIMEKGGIACR